MRVFHHKLNSFVHIVQFNKVILEFGCSFVLDNVQLYVPILLCMMILQLFAHNSITNSSVLPKMKSILSCSTKITIDMKIYRIRINNENEMSGLSC